MTGQLVSDVPRQTARKEVDEPPESLCSMLRELRSRHGLSQYDLAGQLNDASGNSSITREDISRWERGKRIPGALLAEVALRRARPAAARRGPGGRRRPLHPPGLTATAL